MLPALKKLLKNNFAVFLIFFVFGFILYGNSLGNQMFWDDQDNILFNEYIKDWRHFPKYFTENNVAGRGLVSNYWRPLPLIIWSMEWHLWQDWAPGYHFVATLLHIFAGFLLFILLNKIFNNRLLSFLTCIIFLAHPLQTEAITYVSGISDPLFAVTTFATLILYLKYRTEKTSVWLYMSLATYMLSLMARETAVFSVGFLGLVELMLHLKAEKTIKWNKLLLSLVRNLSPFFGIAFAYVFLRLTVLNFQNTLNLYNEENEFTGNPVTRILTFLRILTIYVTLLMFPQNLHMERSVDLATNLRSPDVLLGLAILISVVLAIVFFLKKNRLVVFSLFWITLGLLPTSNILVPINGLLFEHWLYVPMVGFWLLVLWLMLKASINNRVVSVLFIICYLSFVSFLSLKTIQQNKLWRDPVTFYNYILKFAPTSYRVLNNLGMAYAESNDHENAIRTYQQAISVNPENAVAYHNLGNTYKELRNKEEAVNNFEKAINLQPDFYFSYNALADMYVKENDFKKAKEVLEKMLPNTSGDQRLYVQNLISQLESQK